RMARQLVSHGHFTVNGVKVDVPSYQVSQYDIIDVKDKSLNTVPFQIAREVADTVIFMESGHVVEAGSPTQVFNDARHPRTRAFLAKVL
ncbi:MAG: hypothetical protein J0I66_06285, partial [Microbacterium sp.]|nr:hypothetical protein [Microbacterium sp.]